jgi:hypothetical protein
MPQDKKLEKLQKLLEVANEDYATPEDLIALSEGLLNIITIERDRVDKLIAEEKNEDSQEKSDIIALLNEKEKALKHLISELGRSYSDNDEIISTKFSKEIKRLERKIPSKVDLTEIYVAIESLQSGINSFPTELTMNNEAIRDGLELLQGEERLDKSAIKGLDEWYDSILKLASSKNIVAGVRLLRYLSDVNIEGITDGQGIAWNATTNRFEPVTLSGGGGGSVTVTTPTGSVNSSNVTFTNANIAKWIDTDTGHYYENFGYTRSGATYTMDLAPNTYIRLVY